MKLIILVLIAVMIAGCGRPEAPEHILGDKKNAVAVLSDEGNAVVEEKKSLLDYGVYAPRDTGDTAPDDINQAMEEAYGREMAKIDVLFEAAISVSPEDEEVNEALPAETGLIHGPYKTMDKTIEMLKKLEEERSNAAEAQRQIGSPPSLTYGDYPDADNESLRMQEAYESQLVEVDALWKETLVAMQEDEDAADLVPFDGEKEESMLEKVEEEYKKQTSKIEEAWKDTLAKIRDVEDAPEEDVSELRGTVWYVENPYIIVDGKGQGTRRTRARRNRIIDTFWKDGKIAWQKGYYATGQIWYEQTYLDDKVHGMRKEYDISGRLVSEISYVGDKQEGPSRKYHEDGRVTETLWKDDRVISKKEYYPSGALRSVIPYLNDKKNGIQKEYYENGELKQEIPYLNDKRHGTEIYYYRGGRRDGHIIKKKWKENIVIFSKGYYPSGEIWLEVPYVNGIIHGVEKIYDKKSALIGETPYLKGKKHGLSTIRHYKGGGKDGWISKKLWENDVTITSKGYYVSGAMWFETSLVDGKPHGIHRKYDEDGHLIEETPFINGKKHGVQKNYYASGTIEKEIPFYDGELNGYYKIYDRDGNLLEGRLYLMGKLHGVKKTYVKEGQVTETFYKDNRKVSKEVYEDSLKDMSESPQVQAMEEEAEAKEAKRPTRASSILLLIVMGIILALGGVIYAFKALRKRKKFLK